MCVCVCVCLCVGVVGVGVGGWVYVFRFGQPGLLVSFLLCVVTVTSQNTQSVKVCDSIKDVKVYGFIMNIIKFTPIIRLCCKTCQHLML